jgi:hypothetical protein
VKHDLTPEQAGKMLRSIAELTADNSKNWDNFEQIAAGFIRDALAHGRKSARTT